MNSLVNNRALRRPALLTLTPESPYKCAGPTSDEYRRRQPDQMGMTTDRVENALGTPAKIVNLGPKQISVYKDLRVTFFGGKVVDVQWRNRNPGIRTCRLPEAAEPASSRMRRR
jgi:hypothetical protein